MTVTLISNDPAVQAHYEECLANGCSPKLAEMFALAAPPGANTDREFLLGTENGRQFADNPEAGDRLRRVAEAHGQDVTGKKYVAGLARFPGDPEAWVSGKGDVERVLDARGWGAEGCVSRPVSNVAEPLNVAVDPDLVNEEVEAIIAAQVPAEEQHLVDREDLAEQVFEKRKPHWAK